MRSRRQPLSQLGEVFGGQSIAFAVEPADELDDVTSCIATGETSPEIFAKTNDEGVRVIAPVQRAGTDETSVTPAKLREQSFVSEDLFDRNSTLEPLEVQVREDHGITELDVLSLTVHCPHEASSC